MNFFKRSLLLYILPALLSPTLKADDYGLPNAIQEGNILHCFNWKLTDVKAALPEIASAGFGAVQISPMQRSVSTGTIWFDAYRPYDFAFVGNSGLGNEQNLRDLCSEASQYGIKVIVDVVVNHVDGTASNKNLYHDSWWNTNDRLRWLGDVNYSNRYSITHNQLGGASGYPDVNSEDKEVAQRAKAYIENLKSMGVKGIRFDAAKHIAVPSEDCEFWAIVTSVPDMYYYGEILSSPGGSTNYATNLMKEYTQYMSVTDDNYGSSARNNNGVPSSSGNWTSKGVDADKLVYWGESHDTYSNDPPYGGESKNISQQQIDRTYAIVACRNGATALYLSRPNATASANIKIGYKGSDSYKSAAIAAVNKFRNKMNGKEDAFASSGNAAVVTRKGGGAVIVAKSGFTTVSVSNASGYCASGSYKDRVSGNIFTVTGSTISGQVGSTGIAVIYDDNDNNGNDGDYGDDGDKPETFDLPIIKGVYLKNISSWEQPYVWAWTSSANCTASGSWPGDKMERIDDSFWKWEVPAGKTTPVNVIFNIGSSDEQTADLSYSENGVYDNSGKLLGFANGGNSGVDDIEISDSDVTPVYYTLQGMRTDRPSNGIFIVVRGNKVTKEFIK